MGIKWAKLAWEVRLADEPLQCPHTNRFSLLGQSLIKRKCILFGVKCSIPLSIYFTDGHVAWKAHFLFLSQSLLGHSVRILGLVTVELDLSFQVEHSNKGKGKSSQFCLMTVKNALCYWWFPALCILLWTCVPSRGTVRIIAYFSEALLIMHGPYWPCRHCLLVIMRSYAAFMTCNNLLAGLLNDVWQTPCEM